MAQNVDLTSNNMPVAPYLAPTDKLLVVYNAISNGSVANGSPSLRTISISSFGNNYFISAVAPATSSSNGNPGNIAYDANYVYVCVGTNVWKRAPLSTW